MAKRKSADQLVADIEARRERIMQNLESLQNLAKPGNVAHRGLDKAKSYFVDETGALNPKRIGVAAAGVVGFFGLLKRSGKKDD